MDKLTADELSEFKDIFNLVDRWFFYRIFFSVIIALEIEILYYTLMRGFIIFL